MEKFKFNKTPDATQLDIPFEDEKVVENLPIENEENFLSKHDLDELYSGNDNSEEIEKYSRIKEELKSKHNIPKSNNPLSVTQNKNKKKRKFSKNNSIEAILRRDLLR